MKLRTRKGSLRFRLTQTEVTTLADRGAIEETVDIAPDASFGYRLVASSRTSEMVARIEGAQITVEMPMTLVRAWASSSRVGLESEQIIDGRAPLTILVEKDFACLEPRPGEDEDAFPHPGGGGGCA